MAWSSYSWIIGVIIASLGSFISNVGLNLQKLCHMRAAEQSRVDLKDPKHYTRDKTWMAGMVLIAAGSVCDFVALGLAAQSIVAPLGSLTMVANIFVAPLMLGEKITRSEIYSTIAIVIGSSACVAFASHKDTIHTSAEIFAMYSSPRFAIYFVVIIVIIGGMWMTIQWIQQVQEEDFDGTRYPALVHYHRFLYGAISGTVGAQSVLFGKMMAELLINTIAGEFFCFAFFQTYVVLLCAGASVFLQVKWLNAGLRRFDALYMVPIFQTFWILVSVLLGLVFFQEYEELSPHKALLFPTGVLLTVGGVYFLSQREPDMSLLQPTASRASLVANHTTSALVFEPCSPAISGPIKKGRPSASGKPPSDTSPLLTAANRPAGYTEPVNIEGGQKSLQAGAGKQSGAPARMQYLAMPIPTSNLSRSYSPPSSTDTTPRLANQNNSGNSYAHAHAHAPLIPHGKRVNPSAFVGSPTVYELLLHTMTPSPGTPTNGRQQSPLPEHWASDDDDDFGPHEGRYTPWTISPSARRPDSARKDARGSADSPPTSNNSTPIASPSISKEGASGAASLEVQPQVHIDVDQTHAKTDPREGSGTRAD